MRGGFGPAVGGGGGLALQLSDERPSRRALGPAVRHDGGARQVVKQLLGISCHCPSGFGDNRITSCADAVAKAIQDHMIANGYDINKERATQEDLGKQASALLLATDDALRSADQEVGFARSLLAYELPDGRGSITCRLIRRWARRPARPLRFSASS